MLHQAKEILSCQNAGPKESRGNRTAGADFGWLIFELNMNSSTILNKFGDN